MGDARFRHEHLRQGALRALPVRRELDGAIVREVNAQVAAPRRPLELGVGVLDGLAAVVLQHQRPQCLAQPDGAGAIGLAQRRAA